MGGGGEMIKLSWVKLDTWNLDHLGVERGDKIKIRIKMQFTFTFTFRLSSTPGSPS